MMKKILWLIAVVALFGVLSQGVVFASRAPDANCTWEPFQSTELGVRLLVQNCTGFSHYDFSVQGNRIEQHRPTDDTIYGSHTVATLYTKPASQSIRAALTEQFIDTLPERFRETCEIGARVDNRSSVERYTIGPNWERMQQITAAAGTDIPDYSECGVTSDPNDGTYVEYQPGRTKERFAIVVRGQDDPLFDTASLELFSNSFSLRTLLYPHALVIQSWRRE